MGRKISPAFAQAKMEQCLQNIEELDVYVNDVEIFMSDYTAIFYPYLSFKEVALKLR